jgi:GNAT superfamily N-acetyltransferase
MLVYGRRLDRRPGTADPACRPLSRKDLAMLTAFYTAHYPETAFSDWMLAHPFIGYFEAGRMLAAAGTMAASTAHRWALIGNFLTHPSARNRGLGRRVGVALTRRFTIPEYAV